MRIEKQDDKCNKCLLCIQDCVSGVWRLVNGDPTPLNPELCNRCSHCISACPCDAISHDGLKTDQIRKVNRKNINQEIFREVILSRRSIRQYKNEPVPREVIEQVLDLARYAPTASNDQNVGYIVVTDKGLIEETAEKIFGFARRLHTKTKSGLGKVVLGMTGLSNNRYIKVMDFAKQQHSETGRDFILYNAPALILIHGPTRARFASENCNIAATTIVNYVHALGLGTCVIGIVTLALRHSGSLRKKLAVPKNRRVYASLVMGYPAYRHANTVSRKKPEIHWI